MKFLNSNGSVLARNNEGYISDMKDGKKFDEIHLPYKFKM